MTTRFTDHLLEGNHAGRPAFGAVPQGTLYACSDHALIYQSDGVAAWSTWATLGSTPAEILDIPTAETDDTLVLAPDGAGGVEFRAETGGGGGAAFVGAKAYHSTTQTIPNATVTPLLFNSERYDTDGFHSTSSETSKFTVPTGKGGYYLLQGGVTGPAVGNTSSEVLFRLNGSTFLQSASGNNDGTNFWVIATGVALLAVGDYVELVVYHENGSQSSGNATGVDNQNWMAVSLLGTVSGDTTDGYGPPGIYNPDRAPAGTTAQTDEFDDSALHADWTWTTAPTGTVSESEYPGVLYIKGHTTNNLRYLRRAFVPGASTALTVAAKFRAVGIDSSNPGNFAFGFSFMTSADAQIVENGIYNNGGGSLTSRRVIGGSGGGGTVLTVGGAMNTAPVYLLSHRDASNVWSHYYSEDGIAWSLITNAETISTTVSKLAIEFIGESSTRVGTIAVDFIRVWTGSNVFKIGA